MNRLPLLRRSKPDRRGSFSGHRVRFPLRPSKEPLVARDSGRAEAWTIETAPPRWFFARAVGRSDFEKAIGGTVTVEALRARDGSRQGPLRKITFPDGHSVDGYIESR